ncbi:hypothetical protein VTO73DRAFT_11167 [Trametes versicolor]
MRRSRFVQRRRLQHALPAQGLVSSVITRISTYKGRERLGIRQRIAVLRTPTLVRYNIAWGTNTLRVSASVRAHRGPHLGPGRYVRDAYEPEITDGPQTRARSWPLRFPTRSAAPPLRSTDICWRSGRLGATLVDKNGRGTRGIVANLDGATRRRRRSSISYALGADASRAPTCSDSKHIRSLMLFLKRLPRQRRDKTAVDINGPASPSGSIYARREDRPQLRSDSVRAPKTSRTRDTAKSTHERLRIRTRCEGGDDSTDRFSRPPDRFAAARTARTSASRWSATRLPFGKLTKMLSLGCGDLGEARCSGGQAGARTWRTAAGPHTKKADSWADLAPAMRGARLEYAIRYDPGEALEGPAVHTFGAVKLELLAAQPETPSRAAQHVKISSEAILDAKKGSWSQRFADNSPRYLAGRVLGSLIKIKRELPASLRATKQFDRGVYNTPTKQQTSTLHYAKIQLVWTMLSVPRAPLRRVSSEGSVTICETRLSCMR